MADCSLKETSDAVSTLAKQVHELRMQNVIVWQRVEACMQRKEDGTQNVRLLAENTALKREIQRAQDSHEKELDSMTLMLTRSTQRHRAVPRQRQTDMGALHSDSRLLEDAIERLQLVTASNIIKAEMIEDLEKDADAGKMILHQTREIVKVLRKALAGQACVLELKDAEIARLKGIVDKMRCSAGDRRFSSQVYARPLQRPTTAFDQIASPSTGEMFVGNPSRYLHSESYAEGTAPRMAGGNARNAGSIVCSDLSSTGTDVSLNSLTSSGHMPSTSRIELRLSVSSFLTDSSNYSTAFECATPASALRVPSIKASAASPSLVESTLADPNDITVDTAASSLSGTLRAAVTAPHRVGEVGEDAVLNREEEKVDIGGSNRQDSGSISPPLDSSPDTIVSAEMSTARGANVVKASAESADGVEDRAGVREAHENGSEVEPNGRPAAALPIATGPANAVAENGDDGGVAATGVSAHICQARGDQVFVAAGHVDAVSADQGEETGGVADGAAMDTTSRSAIRAQRNERLNSRHVGKRSRARRPRRGA